MLPIMQFRPLFVSKLWRKVPGRRAVVSLFAASSLIAVCGKAWADGPRHPGRYVQPASSYILDPAETPIALDFGSMSIADIQAKLNAARAADTVSPIVLTLTGTYWVTNAPLALPSKTSLVLYGTIEAAPHATATSLIAVTGQSKVAIAGGILEGNHADLAGIDVETSGKVNVDAVTVRDYRERWNHPFREWQYGL